MPAPWMVSASGGLTVIVNALAPELNVIAATVVFAEIETVVVLEVANVAVSVAPLGNPVFGVQFALVSQSPLPGLRFQVALPAKLLPQSESQIKDMVRRSARACVRRQPWKLPFRPFFMWGTSGSEILRAAQLKCQCFRLASQQK
jgi:hypothetical protein